LGEFFRLINNKPLACNLLQVYCKEQDRELLKDFYYQDDRRIESANLSLEESFGEQVSTLMVVMRRLVGMSLMGIIL
jgi:hypothetical protein